MRNTIRAFTLVELIVVIAIFILILAIAVPAFSGMLYSSDEAMAENALRTGLTAGRDAAARSSSESDGAAVFFYDSGGRLSIVPCVQLGQIPEDDPLSQNDPPDAIYRDIFVPLPDFAPVQFPRGWMARGYAPAGTLSSTWYEKTYGAPAVQARGNWVFPETGFYDIETSVQSRVDGEDRQTFMVRFEGGTGKLRMGERMESLVLAVRPSSLHRNARPWDRYRADLAPSPSRYVRRIATAEYTELNRLEKAQLVGDRSADSVMARSVSEVAVYNERKLAGALGARVDEVTGCLYQNQTDPMLVQVGGQPVNVTRINEWLEGRLVVGGQPVPSDARVFTVHHYLGWIQEITGTAP